MSLESRCEASRDRLGQRSPGPRRKLKVIPGANVAPQEKAQRRTPRAPGPGGRGRAEQDPVVRRMQEKFGAEIRTVIDYRDKR